MPARRIHIDCETYRTRNPQTIARITDAARDKRPPGNALKADKAAWDTDEAASARITEALNKTAVNPLHAEILMICCRTEHGVTVSFEAMLNEEEKALRDFAAEMDGMSDANTIWTAFNGKRFDFAVLLNRMTRYGIRPPEHFPVYAGGWRGRVFDTMERLPTYDPFTSFAEACEIYGIACKTTQWRGETMTGARVAEAYEAGEYPIIAEYCAADVQHEEQLYLAMTHGDTWGTFDAGQYDLSVLAEIAADDIPPSYKWAAALPILKSARLI